MYTEHILILLLLPFFYTLVTLSGRGESYSFSYQTEPGQDFPVVTQWVAGGSKLET